MADAQAGRAVLSPAQTGLSSTRAGRLIAGCGNDFWHGTIFCGLAVAPGFIPGASWPAPPPTAAGH